MVEYLGVIRGKDALYPKGTEFRHPLHNFSMMWSKFLGIFFNKEGEDRSLDGARGWGAAFSVTYCAC